MLLKLNLILFTFVSPPYLPSNSSVPFCDYFSSINSSKLEKIELLKQQSQNLLVPLNSDMENEGPCATLLPRPRPPNLRTLPALLLLRDFTNRVGSESIKDFM